MSVGLNIILKYQIQLQGEAPLENGSNTAEVLKYAHRLD